MSAQRAQMVVQPYPDVVPVLGTPGLEDRRGHSMKAASLLVEGAFKRVPFSRVLGTLISETATWDSLAWTYGRKRLGEVLHRQWKVCRAWHVAEVFATS